MGSIEEVSGLLVEWEEADNAGRDVTPVLTRLAEIFELENQAFLKQDPDPFDDRHPSRSQPDCSLGHILKAVFRNQRFVDEMVKVYCQRDIIELNTVVCRVLLDILPGLESVIFQEESFVLKLFQWAETASNPLQTYATGLLAAAMDTPEIASSYREKNAYFVPLMLKRLHEISKSYLLPATPEKMDTITFGVYDKNDKNKNENIIEDGSSKKKTFRSKKEYKDRYDPIQTGKKAKEKSSSKASPVDESSICDNSNCSWTECFYGSYQVFPLTIAAQQRYIIQYLTPLGDYQELIVHVFEENALPLILRYIDLKQNPDVRLAFEALKYLAALFCHKKCAIEFLNMGGLQLLLKVPRLSIAATGVSYAFYYLGYLEETLEKICMSQPSVISNLVSYGLWLLECSQDSSRCYSTIFFGFCFAFKMILHHFDQQDGLRKLFNVMSTLDIFVSRSARMLNDDEMYANRLTTRHVCGSLKRYLEAHLVSLAEEKRRNSSKTDEFSKSNFKASMASNMSGEAVEKNMDILLDLGVIPLTRWKPVDEFINLDGVKFLLELISSYFELSGYSGRAETVKNALDVLKVCVLTAQAQVNLCEEITSSESSHKTGISVLLQAAEGKMLPVADVQRSALLTIINCVCAKIPSGDSSSRNGKKKNIRTIEEFMDKIWRAVQVKNGIIVLINLLSIKTPLTDADSIRALACKALCGLARSQNVKQIISKLPLITDGQLIDLMKEPVLQDKCHEHVQFCKHGLELIERVTGSPLSPAAEYSLNLNKIFMSEVVAKTKVVYHQHQLLQVICDHLTKIGFDKTVHCLQQEATVKLTAPKLPVLLDPFPSTSGYSTPKNQPATPHTPERSTPRITNSATPSVASSTLSILTPTGPQKIVLNKRTPMRSPLCRLQKLQCSGSYIQSSAFSKMKRQSSGMSYKSMLPSTSLDSIVKEYLRKQHSLCKNPMLACPPFDLFEPHKCPEAQNRRNAPLNLNLRQQKREVGFKNGGYLGSRFNTKQIYSRFRLLRTCRDEDGRFDFTTSAFFENRYKPFPKLLIGTLRSHVKIFNINTAKQIHSQSCHFRGLAHIDTKESHPIFITSDGGRIGNSSLWKYESNVDLMPGKLLKLPKVMYKNNFHGIYHMEFGKWSVEKLIGTKGDSSVIIDATTLQELQTFAVGNLGNNYLRNRATLDFSDEIVLTDGLLYDVRSGKLLHKLDKFNSFMNGIFHPNGREIISNTEIWDIRTFKLLRTVAGFDQCLVKFNHAGTVIYAVALEKNSHTGAKLSCFNTFDAEDYSTISTVDVKRPLCHLAVDVNERYISTVETVNELETVCRIYEVGRTKQAGDDNGDDSDDSEEDEEETDEGEVEGDFEENEGQANESQFEAEEDNVDGDVDLDDEEINWITTSESSSDDEETLFSLNTSSAD